MHIAQHVIPKSLKEKTYVKPHLTPNENVSKYSPSVCYRYRTVFRNTPTSKKNIMNLFMIIALHKKFRANKNILCIDQEKVSRGKADDR